MTYSDTIRIISGLLQLGVAWYALRLSRLCKSGRAGWLLFSALALLALAYVLLPINPFRSSVHFAVRADVVMGIISTLLIAAMIHFDLRFRKQSEAEAAERQNHTTWEAKVGDQLEELNKTNDELRQTAASLQTQLGESVRSQQQNEQMSREILNTSRQTETELRQTITELERQIDQLKEANEAAAAEHQKELVEARETARVEAATAAVSEFLPQLSDAADAVKSARRASANLFRSRSSPLLRAAKVLSDSARELAPLFKRNPRGMHIQQHLLQLAQQLAGEQSQFLKKTAALDEILGALEAAAQQRYVELSIKAGLAPQAESTATSAESLEADATAPSPEEAPRLVGDVTQTGTEPGVTESETTLDEQAASEIEAPPIRDMSAESAPAYLGGRVA